MFYLVFANPLMYNLKKYISGDTHRKIDIQIKNE